MQRSNDMFLNSAEQYSLTNHSILPAGGSYLVRVFVVLKIYFYFTQTLQMAVFAYL